MVNENNSGGQERFFTEFSFVYKTIHYMRGTTKESVKKKINIFDTVITECSLKHLVLHKNLKKYSVQINDRKANSRTRRVVIILMIPIRHVFPCTLMYRPPSPYLYWKRTQSSRFTNQANKSLTLYLAYENACAHWDLSILIWFFGMLELRCITRHVGLSWNCGVLLFLKEELHVDMERIQILCLYLRAMSI